MSISSRRHPHGRKPLLLAAAAAVGAASLIAPTSANAALAPVAQGPVGVRDDATGYPSYYKDANGLKLKLCITEPQCVGGDSRPDPSLPARWDNGNLPEEAFYAFAEAEVNLNGGGRLRWRAVLEGAWLAEEVAEDEQMTFTRIQFSGSKIPLRTYPAGTVLTATTPYGNISATVRSDGTLARNRRESIAGTVDNNFTRPATETSTGYGPAFLRWNTVAPDAKSGFLGDPEVDHAIAGAKPGNANAVQVYRGTSIVPSAAVSPRVTLFSVGGAIVP